MQSSCVMAGACALLWSNAIKGQGDNIMNWAICSAHWAMHLSLLHTIIVLECLLHVKFRILYSLLCSLPRLSVVHWEIAKFTTNWQSLIQFLKVLNWILFCAITSRRLSLISSNFFLLLCKAYWVYTLNWNFLAADCSWLLKIFQFISTFGSWSFKSLGFTTYLLIILKWLWYHFQI